VQALLSSQSAFVLQQPPIGLKEHSPVAGSQAVDGADVVVIAGDRFAELAHPVERSQLSTPLHALLSSHWASELQQCSIGVLLHLSVASSQVSLVHTRRRRSWRPVRRQQTRATGWRAVSAPQGCASSANRSPAMTTTSAPSTAATPRPASAPSTRSAAAATRTPTATTATPARTDTCEVATHTCDHVLENCDNGNVCDGIETCNPATGDCVSGDPVDCDDHVVCTADTCDPQRGCQHEPIARCCSADTDCDDGDVCNGAETCDTATGNCQPGTAAPL